MPVLELAFVRGMPVLVRFGKRGGRGSAAAAAVATKTPVATAMAGVKTNNNQLKAAVATVTETTTMTATTRTMKMKAMALLTAARRWQWQRAGGGKSAAEAGSAAARRRWWRRQRGGGGGGSAAMAAARRRCGGRAGLEAAEAAAWQWRWQRGRRRSGFYSASGGRWFPTVTNDQKSQNQKAIPVLERGPAHSRTGTRTKTGSASSRNGLFLIRGLTYVASTKCLQVSLSETCCATASTPAAPETPNKCSSLDICSTDGRAKKS